MKATFFFLLFTSVLATTTTYTSTDNSFIFGGHTSTLNVPDTGNFADQFLTINWLDSDWIGEITITLTSPAGTVVNVFLPSCVDQSFNPVQNWVDTGAGISCPPPATLAPVQPFSTFSGENILGNWDLFLDEDAFNDNNQINGWSMQIDFVAGAGGDPHLLLFDGRTVDVEVDNVDVVYVNLLSSSEMQVNAGIGASTLSSNIKYMHQLGISHKDMEYQLLVDTNQSQFLTSDPILQAITRGDEGEGGELVFDFYQAFLSSGNPRMDFVLSEDSVYGAPQNQTTAAICTISMYDGQYMDEKVFNSSKAVEWRQAPFIRSVIRCMDGLHLQIDVHQFEYQIVGDADENTVWVKSGSLLYILPKDKLGDSEQWTDRRIDVFFTRIPREMETNGMVGQFHESEGSEREERVQFSERETSRIEWNEETGHYQTEIGEEFVLGHNSVFSNEFAANLFV